MMDLSTEYLGLKLKNPIIIASCGLTNSVNKIKKLEESGAGAVVLKSLFEEEILNEIRNLSKKNNREGNHSEGEEYLEYYTKMHDIEKYLEMIKECKKQIKIPIIASINCISSDSWISFAKKVEEAGADALELNVSIMPTDIHKTGIENEKIYFEIIQATLKQLSIPVSLKIGNYSSALAHFIYKLSQTGIAGLVLFNRFFSPDIDIDNLTIINSKIYSSPEENLHTLKWVAIMSDVAQCNLAATTGIHSGTDVIKNILAGADAIQIASTVYINGYKQISLMLEEIKDWMNNKNYTKLQDFRGKMNYKHIKNPMLYERGQFMKYYSEAKV